MTPAPVGTFVVRSLYNRVNVVGKDGARGIVEQWLRVGFVRRDVSEKRQRDRVNGARGFWKRGLNPLLSEFESDALPNELFRSACGLCSAGHAETKMRRSHARRRREKKGRDAGKHVVAVRELAVKRGSRG